MPLDYYSILGIQRDASLEEIKRAYKKLAIRWHPDKNENSPEATERFKEIAEAYDCLADSKKRSEYDTYGAEGLRNSQRSSDFRAPEEIFRSFFGQPDDIFLNRAFFIHDRGFHFGIRGPHQNFFTSGNNQTSNEELFLDVDLGDIFSGAIKRKEFNGRTLQIPLPRGTAEGTKLNAEGMEFTVRQIPHPKFTRSDLDIHHLAVVNVADFFF